MRVSIILIGLVLALGAALIAGSVQAQTNDHLKCYRVKGDLKLKGFVNIETPQFGLEPGCKIGKPKFFCVPATKSDVAVIDGKTKQPITPLPLSAPPAPGDRICWQMKCPVSSPPDQVVTDQFGTQTLTKFKARLLCTPAVKGTEFCGDGTRNGSEECDGGDDATCPGQCQPDCTCPPPTCGDGVVNPASEDCDPPDDSVCPGLCQPDCTCPPATCGDGVVNQPSEDCDPPDDSTCPGQCRPFCTCPLPGAHKCTLDTNPNTFELSLVYQQFTIEASVTGGIDLSCGVIDPNTGRAPCSCTIQSLSPFELPTIGFICLSPGGSCPAGEIDCDGGNDLAWETVADHNIGNCTDNADCNDQCDTYCSNLGGGYVAKADQNDACEGFCSGGDNADDACTADADCLPGGACSGQDPPLGPHDPNNPNICGCQCIRMPAGASSAGDLKCQLPTGINVETAVPCDGTDISISVGTVCIPLSTQASDNVLLNANDGTGSISPATLTGTGGNCLDLETSITAGIALVGQVDFFDTTIGDVKSQTNFICQ